MLFLLVGIQEIQEVNEKLLHQSIANIRRDSYWTDRNLSIVITFLAGFPVLWFLIGRIVLYFEINHIKKDNMIILK